MNKTDEKFDIVKASWEAVKRWGFAADSPQSTKTGEILAEGLMNTNKVELNQYSSDTAEVEQEVPRNTGKDSNSPGILEVPADKKLRQEIEKVFNSRTNIEGGDPTTDDFTDMTIALVKKREAAARIDELKQLIQKRLKKYQDHYQQAAGPVIDFSFDQNYKSLYRETSELIQERIKELEAEK